MSSMVKSNMMEGSYYILLSATVLNYNSLRRLLTNATPENHPQSYNILQDKTMEHPSLYYSSQQIPHLDAMNPASRPGTRSMTSGQRDGFSSATSGLNDFQTVYKHDMNKYLSTGPDTFYDTPTQLDDCALGTEKKWGRNPMKLDVCHTSTATTSLRRDYVPLEADFNITNPLQNIPTNNQGLIWREQLEACAASYDPSGFQPQGMNFPTDAPPCNQFTPQEPSNAQHIDSRPTQYSDDNLCPAAPSHRASSTTFDFGYTAPPQMSGPSYISTPAALSPKIKTEHCEPLGLPADSGILTTCYPTWNGIEDIKTESLDTFTTSQHSRNVSKFEHCEPLGLPADSGNFATYYPTWDVPDDIKTESLDTSTPSYHSRNVSELNDFEYPYMDPIQRPQRPRRQRNPTAIRSKSIDSSYSSTSPDSTPPPPPTSASKNINSLTTLTPSRPIEHDPNLKSPQPSNHSVETEIDPDEIFREFTTFFDNIYPRGGCQMVDLSTPDIPIVNKQHVQDTPEPITAQHSSDQPAGSASSEQSTAPQVKKRKRATSAANSPDPTQHQPSKKPRKKTNHPAPPKEASDDSRRKSPAFLYFCADWECCRSLKSDFGGFRTKEDAQRHLLIHEPDRFLCSLKHDNGKDFSCKRTDNFRYHLKRRHPLLQYSEREELIQAQNTPPPQLITRGGNMNMIAVRPRDFHPPPRSQDRGCYIVYC